MAAESLWMLCLFLFLDGATFSFFTTPLLLHYGKLHAHPWQVALAGGLASSAGSALQMVGLRWLLSARHAWTRRFAPSREKLTAALDRFPSAAFVALMVARATPLPDAPLKLAAAAAGYPVLRYGLAVFLGALPYYYVLALVGRLVKIPGWVLVAAMAAIALGMLIDWLRRRAKAK